MSPKLIRVGATYINRGAGRTRREVLRIAVGIPARWYGENHPPEEPVVEFKQKDQVLTLHLSSFAQWAGAEVKA